MLTSATHPSLLSRVRDPGDERAWRAFEQRYGEFVLRYALARGLQFCDAEDVRQLVFLKLAKYLRGFEYSPGRGRFRGYLGTVVRNVISEWRARPVSPPQAVDTGVLSRAPEADESDFDEIWEREWVSHHYRIALATLRATFDPRSVEVFERLIAGDLPAAVAARFAMSAEAVAKVRQRVRTRLTELVAAQIREEDAE